jgi:hypothetical protein
VQEREKGEGLCVRKIEELGGGGGLRHELRKLFTTKKG